MNFKTPFKVLTTAALIGTLSLSAVAPGAASAAPTTTNVVKANETANLNIASVVLAKKADPADKILVTNDLAGELIGNNTAMNGYEIVAIITEDGTVFDYQLFGEYAGSETPSETLKKMADAGATTTVSGDVKVGEVTDGKLSSTDTPAELPGAEEDFKVTEIAAINAKTLAVNFSKELTAEQKAAVTFEVKKDNTTQLVKADSIEGKTANLVRTNGAAFAAGEYTVTVKGLGEDVTKTVKVEEQKATELAITNEQLTDATATAKVGLELKDQYGEKLNIKDTDYTVTAQNLTQKTAVSVVWNATLKSYIINTAAAENAFKKDDEIKITFLHKATGLTATKTIKVVDGAQLNSITLGDVQLPAGKTLLTEDLTNVTVPVTAKDQYGDDATLVKGSNIEIVSTDESVVAASDVTVTTKDDKQALNIAKFLKAGKTNIIILNKATGETVTLPLEVNEKAGQAYDVALADSAVEIAGASSTRYVDVIVTDKYGNKVEPKDYVNAAFTKTSSNDAVVSAINFETDATNENYGKLAITSASGATKGGKATVTLTLNATGKTAKTDVTIGEEATPFNLQTAKDSKHATSLVVGGETTVKFTAFDQYNTELGATSDYAVKYSLKNESSKAISIKDAAGETGDALNAASVTVSADEAGTNTLVAQLVKTGSPDEVIDTVEVPFTTVANSSETFTYEAEDIAKLYKGNNADYAQDVVVKAKAADGSTITLPSKSILSVTGTSNLAVSGKSATGWKVQGNASSITEDEKGTLTINVKTDEGTKTITKEVTISKEALQTKELKLMNKAVADAETAKELKGLTAADYVGDIAFNTAKLWTVDQFGVKKDFDINDADSVTASGFKGLTGTKDDTFTADSGKVTVADVNGDTKVEAGATYRLTVIKDGVALDIPVTVTNAKKASVATLETVAGKYTIADATLTVDATVTTVAELKSALKLTDSDATFEVVNSSDVVLADTAVLEAGQKVVVTAEDTTTKKPYTVAK